MNHYPTKVEKLEYYLKQSDKDLSALYTSLALLNSNRELFSRVYPNFNFELSEKLEKSFTESYDRLGVKVKDTLVYMQSIKCLNAVKP